MPAKVTLTITEGEIAGESFEFDDRNTCIVGRSTDCNPKLPGDGKTISRHHCLLDINPPDIRIRDFGSLNGTRLNGELIGRRNKDQSLDDVNRNDFPEHDLKHGDLIKLGRTVIRIDVFKPAYCAICSCEIPETESADCEREPGIHECHQCREKHVETTVQREVTATCAGCGKDVSQEVGSERKGDYVCTTCQEDPLNIVTLLIDKAKAGTTELAPVRGFVVEKELGKGGMGAVYLARREETDQKVALKVMLPKVAADEYSKQMFLREAHNTASLKHTNIVQLYDFGESDGAFFFTLEYCRFGSVHDLLNRRGGKLPLKTALNIALQTLDALEYAHNVQVDVLLRDGTVKEAKGVIHRDLSPHNLLLAGDKKSPVVKLADFGLAKAFDAAGLSGMTFSGTVCGQYVTAGKPFFMPRQQVINFKHCGPEVDVWSTAASLYRMLTGHAPREFPKDKKMDIWQVILETNAMPIREREPRIPKRLAEVIDEALIDRPGIKYSSAKQLKRALEKAL